MKPSPEFLAAAEAAFRSMLPVFNKELALAKETHLRSDVAYTLNEEVFSRLMPLMVASLVTIVDLSSDVVPSKPDDYRPDDVSEIFAWGFTGDPEVDSFVDKVEILQYDLRLLIEDELS